MDDDKKPEGGEASGNLRSDDAHTDVHEFVVQPDGNSHSRVTPESLKKEVIE